MSSSDCDCGPVESEQTCWWAGQIAAGGPNPALLCAYKSRRAHCSDRRRHCYWGILLFGDRHRSRCGRRMPIKRGGSARLRGDGRSGHQGRQTCFFHHLAHACTDL